MTGDRFQRRNPLIDDVVDVDAAVKPAPAADEIPPGPTDPLGLPAVDEAQEPDLEPEGDDDEPFDEDVDGRFGRRNPLIDRTLPPHSG